jgi:excisionase family DNA binding protein
MGAQAPENRTDAPEVLTVEEAAALLRVNHKTLREAIHRNEVPGVVRLGRVIRLSRTALLDWVQGSAVLRSGEKS